ncbi:MAG: L-seryl-tRNA(Sec) selenium transferase [Candidatus Cloacimonadota bacterium]|nr:L-seryl-tRNA(Sec) selenium transferase [Candidatus Cloacimonadota bacterium]
MNKEIMKKIPAVDKLLNEEKIKKSILENGRELTVFAIRKTIEAIRKDILADKQIPPKTKIIAQIIHLINSISQKSLKKVINGSGIILHTNLGRSPLGKKVGQEIQNVTDGYSNLEFNLNKAKRGHRDSLIKNLLNFLTNAEDAIIVNNNAAAVYLILNQFAKDKEVIVSRGELIEIGGSFRIPDIMKASNAKMIEVGTTNRTKISDYENAITENTAMIFKAHKSNYSIEGFTEEVNLKELSKLADKHNILFYYDLGSGLLQKPDVLKNIDEPDVKSSLKDGVDILSFSGDKLLGGPQAGIILGKSKFIKPLSKNPLMRVFRVGKLTYAALIGCLKNYLKDESLLNGNMVFSMINRSQDYLKFIASTLQQKLKAKNFESEIVKSKAQVGGGTMPNFYLNSFAIEILQNEMDSIKKQYHLNLLKEENPVLTILREGKLLIDVLTIFEDDLDVIVEKLSKLRK